MELAAHVWKPPRSASARGTQVTKGTDGVA